MSTISKNILQTFSESKLFPSSTFLTDYNVEELCTILYLNILALRILLDDDRLHEKARSYLHAATRWSDWEKWRSDGNDLYVCLHALTGKNIHLEDGEEHSPRIPSGSLGLLKTWMTASSHGPESENKTRRLFTSLDSMLHIKKHSLKSLRRIIQDWPNVSSEEKDHTLSKLKGFMKEFCKDGDLVKDIAKLKREEHDLAESSSSGATCAANVATSVGALGAGFSDEYWRSPYGEPKKEKAAKPVVIRREPPKG